MTNIVNNLVRRYTTSPLRLDIANANLSKFRK